MVTNPTRDGLRHGSLYLYVAEVDAYCEHARAAGARILHEPETMFCGDRRYAAEDPQGHHWFFATHARDVPPDEIPGAN